MVPKRIVQPIWPPDKDMAAAADSAMAPWVGCLLVGPCMYVHVDGGVSAKGSYGFRRGELPPPRLNESTIDPSSVDHSLS